MFSFKKPYIVIVLVAASLFFWSLVSSAQVTSGNYVTIQKATPLRVLKQNILENNSTEGLKELPAGSVIWVPQSSFDPTNPIDPGKVKYRNQDGKQDRGSFVGNIKVISAPGFSREQLQNINSNHGSADNQLYVSFKMLLEYKATSWNPNFEPPTRPGSETTGGINPSGTCCQTDTGNKNLTQLQEIVDAAPSAKTSSGSLIQPSAKVADCVKNRQELIDMVPKGEVKTSAAAVFAKYPELPSSAKTAIQQAFDFLTANLNTIKNRNYMTVVDYTQPSSAERFYSIDLSTGEIVSSEVSHGRVSDDGKKQNFTCHSNRDGSNASPSGFLIAGDIYTGQHGRSVRLHGLEGKNALSCDRYIVVHQASYVGNDQGGRSQGCPAIPKSKQSKNLIEQKIANGSLFYNYTSDIRECTQNDIDSKKATGKKKKKKRRS